MDLVQFEWRPIRDDCMRGCPAVCLAMLAIALGFASGSPANTADDAEKFPNRLFRRTVHAAG
jgi:hypothetical protein